MRTIYRALVALTCLAGLAVPSLARGPASKPAKVEICHKGRTLIVSEAAVAAHLRHGDILGPCDASPPDDGGYDPGDGDDSTGW